MTMRMLGTLVALVLLSTHGMSQVDASKWKLTWSDEFNAADGTAPDPTKWGFDLGGGGWGNKELESYTSPDRSEEHTSELQSRQSIS